MSSIRQQEPVRKDGAGRHFGGFVTGSRAAVIPASFFTEVLPFIEDAAELRVSLYLFYALGRKRGYPRYVTRRELEALPPLAESLAVLDGEIADNLERGLVLCAERGAFLAVTVEREGHADTVFFLNTPSDRRAYEQLRSGSLDIALPRPQPAEPPQAGRENVFLLYEENVGPITPLVAEELREAERLYPYDWIEDALREAALLNKRSWRYAARILERWAVEGRQREETGRDPGGDDSIRSRVIRRFDHLAGER